MGVEKKEYKKISVTLFKPAVDEYKKRRNNGEESKLEEVAAKDRMIFNNIQSNFRIIAAAMQFCVLSDSQYFYKTTQHLSLNTLSDYKSLTISTPKNDKDLINAITTYPVLLEIEEYLREIVLLENYELLVMVNKFNPLFYSNIVNEALRKAICNLETEVDQMSTMTFLMVKKLLRKFITFSLEFSPGEIEPSEVSNFEKL